MGFEGGFQIEPDVSGIVRSCPERIARNSGAVLSPPHCVRQKFHQTVWPDLAYPCQRGKTGNISAFLFWNPGVHAPFVFAFDGPEEIDPPGVAVFFLEMELVEGNADFHSPSPIVDTGGIFPYPIPCHVHTLVIEQGAVPDGSGRIDGKLETAAPVIIGIHGKNKPVRLHFGIAAAQKTDDPLGIAVVQAGGHIKAALVIGHPDYRFLRSRDTVLGIGLTESREALRLPDIFAQYPVHLDGSHCPYGPDGSRFGSRIVGCRKKRDKKEQNKNHALRHRNG